MKIAKSLLLVASLAAFTGAAWGSDYEPSREDEGNHTPAIAYEWFLLGPGETLDPGIARADLDYADGMKRHHQAAVAMAREYLDDPRGTNPLLRKLAGAIIANQRFEIALLDDIRRRVGRGPRTVLDLGFVRIVALETGVDGLEHRRRFLKHPSPGLPDLAFSPGLRVSEFDVKFAREMILHHRMALDMARAYDGDPRARNRLIRLLNLGILRDQAYEIGLLEGLVGRFPGDPAAVAIDSSMGRMMGLPGSGTRDETAEGAHGGHGTVHH